MGVFGRLELDMVNQNRTHIYTHTHSPSVVRRSNTGPLTVKLSPSLRLEPN